MVSRVSSLVTPGLGTLSARIAAIVARGGAPVSAAARVAGVLGDALPDPCLVDVDALAADPAGYCQTVLHSDPAGRFSIVALVWLPGQRTPIHDHVSWCVVGVYRGAEESTLYRLVGGGADARYLVRTGHTVDQAGATSYLAPPGDIHEVANTTDMKAVSIHVYGADVAALGSSIRRRYDLPVRAGV